MTPQARLSEETRQSLADSAAAAERRNRPRYLVVAAASILAGAVLVLFLALSHSAQVAIDLSRERAMGQKVEELMGKLTALNDAEQKVLGDKAAALNSRVFSMIEEVARDVGLKTGPKEIQITPGTDRGPGAGPAINAVRRTYSAVGFNPQETELLIRWIARVTTEIEGVQLQAIDLNPALATVEGKPRVTGRVVFSRWERRQ